MTPEQIRQTLLDALKTQEEELKRIASSRSRVGDQYKEVRASMRTAAFRCADLHRALWGIPAEKLAEVFPEEMRSDGL